MLRRSRVIQEKESLIGDIVERNDQITTRAALADIFWLAIGALLIGTGRADDHRTGDV